MTASVKGVTFPCSGLWEHHCESIRVFSLFLIHLIMSSAEGKQSMSNWSQALPQVRSSDFPKLIDGHPQAAVRPERCKKGAGAACFPASPLSSPGPKFQREENQGSLSPGRWE